MKLMASSVAAAVAVTALAIAPANAQAANPFSTAGVTAPTSEDPASAVPSEATPAANSEAAPAIVAASAPAPAPTCELHVFPTLEGQAQTTGWLMGFGMVGAIADAAAHKDNNISDAEYLKKALGPEFQVSALKTIDLVKELVCRQEPKCLTRRQFPIAELRPRPGRGSPRPAALLRRTDRHAKLLQEGGDLWPIAQ